MDIIITWIITNTTVYTEDAGWAGTEGIPVKFGTAHIIGTSEQKMIPPPLLLGHFYSLMFVIGTIFTTQQRKLLFSLIGFNA